MNKDITIKQKVFRTHYVVITHTKTTIVMQLFGHVSSWYPFLRPHHTALHHLPFKYRSSIKISNQISHK